MPVCSSEARQFEAFVLKPCTLKLLWFKCRAGGSVFLKLGGTSESAALCFESFTCPRRLQMAIVRAFQSDSARSFLCAPHTRSLGSEIFARGSETAHPKP